MIHGVMRHGETIKDPDKLTRMIDACELDVEELMQLKKEDLISIIHAYRDRVGQDSLDPSGTV